MADGNHTVTWYAEDYADNDNSAAISFVVASAPASLIPPPPVDFRAVSVIWDPATATGRVTFAWRDPDDTAIGGTATTDGFFIIHDDEELTELPGHWLSAIPSVGDVIPEGGASTCIWVGDGEQTACTVTGQALGEHDVAAYSYHSI
jgi:hypothetical protein